MEIIDNDKIVDQKKKDKRKERTKKKKNKNRSFSSIRDRRQTK